MNYIVAALLPCVTFFSYGRPSSGIIALCLMVTGILWPVASIWALSFAYSERTDPSTKLVRNSLKDNSNEIRSMSHSISGEIRHGRTLAESRRIKNDLERWNVLETYDLNVRHAVEKIRAYDPNLVNDLRIALRHININDTASAEKIADDIIKTEEKRIEMANEKIRHSALYKLGETAIERKKNKWNAGILVPVFIFLGFILFMVRVGPETS